MILYHSSSDTVHYCSLEGDNPLSVRHEPGYDAADITMDQIFDLSPLSMVLVHGGHGKNSVQRNLFSYSVAWMHYTVSQEGDPRSLWDDICSMARRYRPNIITGKQLTIETENAEQRNAVFDHLTRMDGRYNIEMRIVPRRKLYTITYTNDEDMLMGTLL